MTSSKILLSKKCLTILATMLMVASCDSGPLKTETPAQTPLTQNHQRLIPIAHTRNFRDLGGYQTHDGRSVKWGILYRSDTLAHLDEEGLDTLKDLNLSLATDLRSDTERADNPDRLPVQTPPLTYQTLAVNDHSVDISEFGRKIFAGQITQEELDSLVGQKRFMDNPEILEAWGQWVRQLADPKSFPQLFHCTSGKDRTGYGAAMVLLTLGVPEDQVMEDFLLSNEYLKEFIEATIQKIQNQTENDVDLEMLRSIMGVRAKTLEGTLAQMRSEYGSVDGFIEKGLGIDAITRKKIQDNLLE